MNRDKIVTDLYSKNTVNVNFMNNDLNLLEKFKESFEKDMILNSSSKYVEKYAIENPFEELIEIPHYIDSNGKKLYTSKSKWDDVKTSPKYMAALDKVLSNCKVKETDPVETNIDTADSTKKWSPIDDKFKFHIKNFMKNECQVNIKWPRGFFKTENIQMVSNPKNKPTVESKTKKTKNRFCTGVPRRAKITCKSEEYFNNIEQVIEPPSWEELEEMRVKCLDWLNDHCQSNSPDIKPSSNTSPKPIK